MYLYGHAQVTDPVHRKAIFRQVEEAKEKAEEEFDVEAQPDIVTQEEGIRIFVPDLEEDVSLLVEFGNHSGRSMGSTHLSYILTKSCILA